jgi:hypothetical protein
MSEKPCDGFEVAIEMRRHGAADPEASRRLDAHLAGCGRCQAYEELAGGSDEALRRRTGDAGHRMDWDGLLGRISAGRRGAFRAAQLGAALWAALLACLWLARSGFLSVPFLDPLPRALPVLVTLTFFGVFLNGARVVASWERRRELDELGSASDVLGAHRRDLRRSLRLGRWASLLTLILIPAAAWRWSRFHGPFDAHALVTLLGQLGLLAVVALFFFVRRPRLQREDAELARFDVGSDRAA